MKTCSKCKESKTVDSFSKRKDTASGFRADCKICHSVIAQKYYQNNKDKIRELNKEWRKKNPEKSNAIYARYRSTDKRKIVANGWAKKNRSKQTKYFRERYHSDEQFNITIKYRRRIYMALKSQEAIKGDRIVNLLGCSFPFYKKYLSDRFTYGMSWKELREGKIHIDHIKPCSSFDLTDEEEQKKCFHYSNTQPLWAADNLKKSDKIS